jgi:PAS domain S-box-containing protein
MDKRSERIKVLIVEDEIIIAKDIQQRLETLGYEVTDLASTGEEAIESVLRNKPDIVLMDIVFKLGMDGIETAGILRTQHELPVVFLTAFSDDRTIQRAKTKEPFGFILKPFLERELLVNIEIALQRHATERHLRDSEEGFRRLAEATFEGVLIHRDGVAIEANGRMSEMLGYGEGELVGKDVLAFAHPSCREILRERLRTGDDLGWEISMLRKDGAVFPAGVVGKSIPYKGRTARVMVVRDLSAQKQAEKLMKEKARSELYGFVVSAMPLIVPGAYQQVREDLLKIFADRFEGYFKPLYEEYRKVQDADAPHGKPLAFDQYIAWVKELFSNFGMAVTSSSGGDTGRLELHNCPWIEFSQKNPVFCLLCRAMASRSFSWVSTRGAVGMGNTIAGGHEKCVLDFRDLANGAAAH